MIIIDKIKTFFASFLSKTNKKFECYEIHRPNIPANGCHTQCIECKNRTEILKNVKTWWDKLQPHEQQELCAKYFPKKQFGALSADLKDIEIIYERDKRGKELLERSN